MNTYIARQPILDRNMQIKAYELLFRSSENAGSFSGTDSNFASSHTIMDSFQTIGIETITGGKPAFINFTENLLLKDVATLFPKNLLVIEVLETVEPTPEIIAACANLSEKGYTLALDDFVYRPALEPLIKISKIIKFDFLESSLTDIYGMLRNMDVSDKQLLAEKIETKEMFDYAVRMGFTLFQGYFFSKPVTVASKSLAPLNTHYMSLLKEMQAGDDMDFGKIAETIRSDLALCHRLLRMVNSAYYGMRSGISDIQRALAVLGTKEIRKWIYLMTLLDIKAGKPDELIRMSLTRGFFMEQLAKQVPVTSKENLFLTGMFSLIDALTEKTMESALSDMAIAPEIGVALIEHKGKLYELLQLVISIENGEWDETDRLALSLGIDSSQLSRKYLSAVKWCDESL